MTWFEDDTTPGYNTVQLHMVEPRGRIMGELRGCKLGSYNHMVVPYPNKKPSCR